jgi:hypothetical protein
MKKVSTYNTNASRQKGLRVCETERSHFFFWTLPIAVVVGRKASIDFTRVPAALAEGSSRIVFQFVIAVVVQGSSKVESPGMMPPPARRMGRIAVKRQTHKVGGFEERISETLESLGQARKGKTGPTLRKGQHGTV